MHRILSIILCCLLSASCVFGATHRISIVNSSILPASDEVFFEAYSTKATNDNWDFLVLIFNDTSTKDAIHGKFVVPQDYVGTANLIIVWTSAATSGDVEWDFDYRAVGGNDTESMDQATAQESIGTNDTAPSAAQERMEISISITDANLASGDEVEFILYRDGTDAGDTMSDAAIVFSVIFEYSDA